MNKRQQLNEDVSIGYDIIDTYQKTLDGIVEKMHKLINDDDVASSDKNAKKLHKAIDASKKNMDKHIQKLKDKMILDTSPEWY